MKTRFFEEKICLLCFLLNSMILLKLKRNLLKTNSLLEKSLKVTFNNNAFHNTPYTYLHIYICLYFSTRAHELWITVNQKNVYLKGRFSNKIKAFLLPLGAQGVGVWWFINKLGLMDIFPMRILFLKILNLNKTV